jgi:hypothetical protein
MVLPARMIKTVGPRRFVLNQQLQPQGYDQILQTSSGQGDEILQAFFCQRQVISLSVLDDGRPWVSGSVRSDLGILRGRAANQNLKRFTQRNGTTGADDKNGRPALVCVEPTIVASRARSNLASRSV